MIKIPFKHLANLKLIKKIYSLIRNYNSFEKRILMDYIIISIKDQIYELYEKK